MLCCTTVQRKRYYTTNSNKIHINTTTNTVYIFIHFDDNTSRFYTPYRTLKLFVLYSSTRCTISIDITRSSAHKTSKNRSKSIEKSIVFILFSTAAIQVLKSSRRSDRTVSKTKKSELRAWLTLLYRLKYKQPSVYCSTLHLTIGIHSKVYLTTQLELLGLVIILE